MSYLISYHLFLTESAKTFGDHLQALRGLKDEAIQRKMAVEKELSEKIDVSSVLTFIFSFPHFIFDQNYISLLAPKRPSAKDDFKGDAAVFSSVFEIEKRQSRP